MHSLDLPAGSTIRLTATARPDVGVHRWDMQVFAADSPPGHLPPRLVYGSQIGGRDCDQRIQPPPQDKDCRIEVSCRHPVADGWQDDQVSIRDDAPGLLAIGFSDQAWPTAQTDDVLLTFTFTAASS